MEVLVHAIHGIKMVTVHNLFSQKSTFKNATQKTLCHDTGTHDYMKNDNMKNDIYMTNDQYYKCKVSLPVHR